MLLESVRAWKRLLCSGFVVAGLGCTSTNEVRTSQLMNDQMNRMDKMGKVLEEPSSPSMVRSQSPPESRPIVPVSRIKSKSEAQVRIVATVGDTPIYESEVREAVNQKLIEFNASSASERQAKEDQFFIEELRRIIERELLLDEMYTKLKSGKGKASVLEELEEAAKKEADRQLKEFRNRIKLPSDDDFAIVLQGQGVTLSGMRRQLERGFMMRIYLKELISTKVNNISVAEVRDYYNDHAKEFQTDDRVKWQDIFISASKYASRDDAKKVATQVLQRAQRGEDFMKLAQEFDQGLGKGVGDGETRGSIRPIEAENMVFKMKAGEVNWFEIETGFHIIRVADRLVAGRKPFDEKVQTDIRRKLQSVVSDREYARIIETLWRRNPPQLFVDK